MKQPHDRETVVKLLVKLVMAFINEAKLEHVWLCVAEIRVWLCVRTHLYTSHLCRLDVTVHLVVQLAHLELQQRERGDMSFRNKACSEATAEVPDGCGLDQSQHTAC